MGLTGDDVVAGDLAEIGVREDITEQLREVIDTTLEEREKRVRRRRSGRRSSDSSCCARSTRCGSST